MLGKILLQLPSLSHITACVPLPRHHHVHTPSSAAMVPGPELTFALLFTFTIANINQSVVTDEPSGKFSVSTQDIKRCL